MTSLKIGDLVIRGPTWRWYDQDYKAGYLGIVQEDDNDEEFPWRVKWFKYENGSNVYRTDDLIRMDSRLNDETLQSEYNQMLNSLYADVFDWKNFCTAYKILKNHEVDLSPLLTKEIVNNLNAVIDNNKIFMFTVEQHKYSHQAVGEYWMMQRKILSVLWGLVEWDKNSKISDDILTDFSWIKESLSHHPINPMMIKMMKNKMIFHHCQKDWFGFRKISDRSTVSKLKPINDTDKCVMCEESMEDTDYTYGILTDCGCHYHIECAFDWHKAIKQMAEKDILSLTLDCIGCEEEITIQLVRNLLMIEKWNSEASSNKVDLDQYVIKMLAEENVEKEIEFLNDKVIEKTKISCAENLIQCPNCKFDLFMEPDVEFWKACPGCNNSFLAQGSLKKKVDQADKEMLLKLIESDSSENFKMCTKCHKLIEKNGGCNHMECGFCKTSFYWDTIKNDDLLLKVHF